MRSIRSTLSGLRRNKAYWVLASGVVVLACVGLGVGMGIRAFSREPAPPAARASAVREQPVPQLVTPKELRMTEWPLPQEAIDFGFWLYPSNLGVFDGSVRGFDWQGGKYYAFGAELWIQSAPPGSGWARAGEDGYQVAYPPLRRGDIVPVGRGVYRVERVRDAQVFLKLTLLDPKDVPAGVSLGRNSYVYPLYEPVYTDGSVHSSPVQMGKLHGCDLNVSWIIRPRLNPDVPVAVIDTCVPVPSEGTPWKDYREMPPQRVRAGDILKIGRFRHRVRKIVPPDPEHQVIGWVELDPDPLPDQPEQKD